MTSHLLAAACGVAVGALTAYAVRRVGARWTWPSLAGPIAALLWQADTRWGLGWGVAVLASLILGARRHASEIHAGVDLAERARRRPGIALTLRAWRARRHQLSAVDERGLVLGLDESHRPVRVALGTSASHTLVVGATGSGKTVTQALLLERLIGHGYGAIVIDPKGDDFLQATLADAIRRAGRRLLTWTPTGPSTYNPFAHGSASEIADKALAGERYTEPHYQRQAQRYLAHAARALQAGGRPVSLAALVDVLDPQTLEALARDLPAHRGDPIRAYVNALTAEQLRGLAGTRDRLAILAESDLGPWLQNRGPRIDLHTVMTSRGVAYFRLDADRWPLLAQMLGAAIVQDLITLTAEHQRSATRAVVAIDEFSAIAPEQIVRLFARARSAGISLLVGAQELADLNTPEHPALLHQVLGNTAILIAHRQRVPESAELIAQVAGTRGAWTQTRKTAALNIATNTGTRKRAREFHAHPDELKHLPTGTAIVIEGGQTPRRTRILHPGVFHTSQQ